MNNVNQENFVPETVSGNEGLSADIADTRNRTDLTLQIPEGISPKQWEDFLYFVEYMSGGYIKECIEEIFTFPGGGKIRAKYELDLFCYSELNRLPDGLSVDGDLSLYGCTGFKKLPDDLSVDGDLYLSPDLNEQVKKDAERLKAEGKIRGEIYSNAPDNNSDYDDSCNYVVEDDDFYFDMIRGSEIDELMDLEQVGVSLKQLYDLLYLMRAADQNKEWIDENFIFSRGGKIETKGDLCLGGYTELLKLPNGLCINGNLSLDGCTELKCLPEELTVTGHLFLEGCTSLVGLSKWLIVGGNVYLSDNSHVMTRMDVTALKQEGKITGSVVFEDDSDSLDSLSDYDICNLPDHEIDGYESEDDNITLEDLESLFFESYDEAKKAPDGTVVLEGDYWGGQVYLTCPMKYVQCSEKTLRNLLREIDSFEWDCNGEEGFAITYLKSKPGDYIDGGMGGGAVEDGLWIHEDIADDKKELIRKVINGELASII